MHKQVSEKGQALILIAFAAILLFGFAALAIDGSMKFSDNRHAQNAADGAAMAGALAQAHNQDVQTAALKVATSNGYINDGSKSIVEIHTPPVTGPYSGNGEYIEVDITSHV